MAVIVDPTGAVFNIWQAKNHPGAGLVNDPGAWSWNELISSDVAKAAEFYNKVLGWTPNKFEGPMEYTELKLDGNSIGGAMPPPMPGIPSMWTIYFSVDDTDKTVDKIKKLGGNVMNGPTDIPPGRFAVVTDPQGAMFNIIKFAPQT
jgi:predicted enzyme related to lactoylglutathione lyase